MLNQLVNLFILLTYLFLVLMNLVGFLVVFGFIR
jgi:hypothetical protein